MITIENLEVNFDVAGEGDEKVFAQYFARYIEQWSQHREQERMLRQRLRRDQMLGDENDTGDF